ncbi:lipase 3-like [Microplitis mediator]|uniref:lipase 3-like n=1 Tax=Microplitis mediator TaxID=375433 RepID=UPI002552EDBE|nr:lipase 3-like [Microplitis mediator]
MKIITLLLITQSIKLASSLKLLPHEKLIKVQTPQEANGTRFILDFIGIARQFGYKAEQHNVTTSDGYILQIFRIPNGKESVGVDNKPAILIEHGLMASADIWATMKRSLAYFLADAGYDVWIGNVRGNTYGRAHQTLSPDNPLFWNFTFHEYGVIDYAETIDYVLGTINQTSLTYIGHSMGGTAVFILLSEKPEYNEKLKVIIALSPSAYWKAKIPTRQFSLSSLYHFGKLIDPTGLSEFMPQSAVFGDLFKDLCQKNNIMDLCVAAVELASGYDYEQIDNDEMIYLSYYYPAGTSTKTVYHYCQCVISGDFRQFDYEENNIYFYGQVKPPAYNVSNIVAPMVIIYGENDPLSTLTDNKELARRVMHNVTIVKVDYPKFSHLDFVKAKDVKKLLYPKLMDAVSKYN